MKKLVTVSSLWIIGFTTPCLHSVVSAQDATVEKKVEASGAEATAIKGTPSVDGEVDDLWADVPEAKVDKIVTSESTVSEKEMATATVKLLWDDEHLYALWHVKDSKLAGDGSGPHENDSIELFVDELNQKAGDYQEDDAQYRVSFDGKLSGGDTFSEDKVKAIAKKTDDGYLVEMSVKLSHAKREAGTRLGLELQVNDNTGNGTRSAVAKWNHNENDSYLSTSDFGTVVLK
jgi:endo-1,4-beta-xylanase